MMMNPVTAPRSSSQNDLALRQSDGTSVVYPCGSEEQWRFERFLELLAEIDKERLAQSLDKQRQDQEEVVQILDEPNQKIILTRRARELKQYNLTQAAKILGIAGKACITGFKRAGSR